MRYNFSLREGSLLILPHLAPEDSTSVRLALQIGVGIITPFILSMVSDVLFQQPGLGLLCGGAFGTTLVIRTVVEAEQIDSEHRVKVEHARALSEIEIREREHKLLPEREESFSLPSKEEEWEEVEESVLERDVKAFLSIGIRKGTFARSEYIQPRKKRLTLPSGEELTRPKYEQIISSLLDDGLLIKGLNGSPTLPYISGRQEGAGEVVGQAHIPFLIGEGEGK